MSSSITFHSYRKAFEDILLEIGRKRKDIVVIDADVGKSTKTAKFAQRYPDRYINVGISEQDMIGVASGLAIKGFIPIVSAFSMFILRGWEILRNVVSRDNLNVKIIATHSGFSDHIDGSSHQCLEDIALMRILPRFTVTIASDDIITRSLVEWIIDIRGPAYIRLGRDNAIRVYDTEPKVGLKGINKVAEGSDIAIVSSGPMTGISLIVHRELIRRNVSAAVYDLYLVKPEPIEEICRIAKKYNSIITVEEHRVRGGIGSMIAEITSEICPTRVIRIGVDESFGFTSLSYYSLLDYFGLSPYKLVDTILKILGRSK